MLECLKQAQSRNFDVISFVEDDESDLIKIVGSYYENYGEKLGGSELGETYHIVLFRDSKTDPEKYDDFETFDAILGDPLEYVSGLIPKSIYGMVAKKTTTSGTFIGNILDNIREMEYTVTVFSK